MQKKTLKGRPLNTLTLFTLPVGSMLINIESSFFNNLFLSLLLFKFIQVFFQFDFADHAWNWLVYLFVVSVIRLNLEDLCFKESDT